MNWILIIVVLSGYGPRPIVVTADFTNQANCMAARAEIRGAYQRASSESLLLTVNCFPK